MRRGRRRRRRQEIVYRRIGTGRSSSYYRRRRRKIILAWVIALTVLVIGLSGVFLWKSLSDTEKGPEGEQLAENPGREDGLQGGSPSEEEGAGTKEGTGTEESAGSGEGAGTPEGDNAGESPGTPEGTDSEESSRQDSGEQDRDFPGNSGFPEDSSRNPGAQNYAADADRPKVKGIYVTGPRAGSDAFEDLLTLVDTTELNAMVIDVKNDNGEITFRPGEGSDLLMGATLRYIRDMEAFMERLKEHHVYTIARIVCFKDPYLASNMPELALLDRNGAPVVDGNDVAWVNPYSKGVWDYLIEVAKLAGSVGFDEIQFDYVRFPLGDEAENAVYGVDTSVYTKQQAITDFLNYAVDELGKVGLPVTADVFGTIIGNETDAVRVGQDYTVLGETIAAICPMVYPSHYANGVFGLDVPDAWPYETVLSAMLGSKEDLISVPAEERAVVRPWLQAFTADWVKGHIEYGGTQIRDQIQAVYDAGYEEWILWNASNRYSAEGLLEE